jgi:2-dehydropantoate 2-reductase
VKIAVVGTGAMGSVYAALLGKAGHEVWAIDTWREHVDAIANSGLTVSGASGNYVVDNLHVGQAPRDAGACDVWVIATKAWAVDEVAAEIAPLLRPDSIVMAFQNGLGAGERVARHIQPEHILMGIAEGFGSSIPSPGHVHHEGMRMIRIGEMHGGLTERVLRIEEAWRDAGFNVKAFDDVTLMIWEKFLCNVTLSAPCAAFPTPGRLPSGAPPRHTSSESPLVSDSPSRTRCAMSPNSPARFPTPARPCALTTSPIDPRK